MVTSLPPSIFNDVVGPVMRGPSSSHSAASVRIARMARDLVGGQPDRVLVEFDSEGSLATTHESQGSDIGLFGGLLGWDADDPRLGESAEHLAAAGIEMEIKIARLDDPHPNTYRLTLWRGGEAHRMVAISTGGGMIEVIEIDGAPVSLRGDYDVTLIDLDGNAARCVEVLAGRPDVDVAAMAGDAMVAAQGKVALSDDDVGGLAGVRRIRRMAAVLPVRSRAGMTVPFLHAGEMVETADPDTRPLSSFALEYECARGGLGEAEVMDQMRRILQIVRGGIQEGLAGTEYTDRVRPRQSHRVAEKLAADKVLQCVLARVAAVLVLLRAVVRAAHAAHDHDVQLP